MLTLIIEKGHSAERRDHDNKDITHNGSNRRRCCRCKSALSLHLSYSIYTMRRRGRNVPRAIVGAFLSSLLMLMVGIHQTAHISSRAMRHEDNIMFGPPVPLHGHRLLKNISIDVNNTVDISKVNIKDKSGNVTVTDLRPKTFPHSPKVKYLGVLIDAGRHYFPIMWLKDLIDTLHRMKFNLIHFRLTDDQAFAVKLQSHPELAKPSAVNNPKKQVYSVEELSDLIDYAAKRNISIMPEVNVPGHAGAWAGIPDFVVPCPEFICLKGYGACLLREGVFIVPSAIDSRVRVVMTALSSLLTLLFNMFRCPAQHFASTNVDDHQGSHCRSEGYLSNLSVPAFGRRRSGNESSML